MGQTTGRTETILVVDDDEALRQIIAAILEENGYRVLLASGGGQALLLLDMIRPDLIVSDIMMPEQGGLAFFAEVRSRPDLAQVPFIFLTGRCTSADIRQGMALGADDYLTKPFEPCDLLAAISVRLARAATARASINETSEKLKRVFVQTMTHELRTPVSLIFGYTDLLQTMGLQMSEEDLRMILRGLHTGGRRLMGLIEDFVLLSRLETGILAQEIREVPLTAREPDAIVRATVQDLEREAATRQVALFLRLGAPASAVAMRDEFVAQIVRRLVQNAIKFSKKQGGTAVVSTHQDGLRWFLEIVDNGVGIRADALQRIFQPFQQVDREKMEQQGTGLGLVIVRGLAEVHGGSVHVESQEGRGSLFQVRLPLVHG